MFATGKTTFLVNVICRSLYQSECDRNSRPRRLMVCAPTNKAVSILAARFLDAINWNSSNFTAVLVGDADKLLLDDSKERTSPLRSIFLHSWMTSIINGYDMIRSYFTPGCPKVALTAEDLYVESSGLEKRLRQCSSIIPPNIEETFTKISAALQQFKEGGTADDIVSLVDGLVSILKTVNVDLFRNHLLSTANVIFCTLMSSGGAILKSTSPINDLIVDEAGAATEPSLYIPFHLKPTRLLAAGDPAQLPPTVLSRRASDLGLSRSLLDRLMHGCGYAYAMLDVQYRMNPAIASFPALHFYNSKVINGDNVSHSNYKAAATLLDGKPYTFLQIAGAEEQVAGGSYRNRLEAAAVVNLICQLRAATSTTDPSWFSSDRVRIITFYQAQVTLLTSALKNQGLGMEKVVVSTVDSSQGCEADIVLLSFVRSTEGDKDDEDMKNSSAGFLTVDRRMNVALTRARHQLICIGNVCNFRTFRGALTLRLLANNAEKRNVIRAFSQKPIRAFKMKQTKPFQVREA